MDRVGIKQIDRGECKVVSLDNKGIRRDLAIVPIP